MDLRRFGDRLTQSATTGAPPTSTLAYAQATNRITTAGYSYDLNGNLTAMPGVSSIVYDVFDRAVSITKGAVTTQAKYDAFGRRVEQTLGTGAKRVYFYGLSGELLAEYDAPAVDVQPSRVYRYLAGRRVGNWVDRVGTVRYTTSGTYSHSYPYGEEITTTANDRYKFADLYRDADTGLDYAMARYFSSGIGRFLSVDRGPVDPSVPSTWNPYTYSIGDPVNGRDPAGTFPEFIGGPPPAPPGTMAPFPGVNWPWACQLGSAWISIGFRHICLMPLPVAALTIRPQQPFWFLVKKGDCYTRNSNEDGTIREAIQRNIRFELYRATPSTPAVRDNAFYLWENLEALTPNAIEGIPNPNRGIAPGEYTDRHNIGPSDSAEEKWLTQQFFRGTAAQRYNVPLFIVGFPGGPTTTLIIRKTSDVISINGDWNGHVDADGKFHPFWCNEQPANRRY